MASDRMPVTWKPHVCLVCCVLTMMLQARHVSMLSMLCTLPNVRITPALCSPAECLQSAM